MNTIQRIHKIKQIQKLQKNTGYCQNIGLEDSSMSQNTGSISSEKGGINMNGILKGMLIAFTIIYIVSPVDFMPGPIDDIIVLLLTVACPKLSSNLGNNYIEDNVE